MKTTLICILMMICINATAQKRLSLVDSATIKQADKAVTYILNGKARADKYLIFCWGDFIVYVAKSDTGYVMYTGEIFFNVKTQQKEVSEIEAEVIATNKILDKCFSSNVCKPSFVFTASDPTVAGNIGWDSRFIYFVISDFKTKACEFNVPITYNLRHQDKRSKIPLQSSVLGFLMSEGVVKVMNRTNQVK